MREVAHAGGILAPRQWLPDAVLLLLESGGVGALGRELGQEPRERRVGLNVGHQCSSAPR